jgi:hypothetical protein
MGGIMKTINHTNPKTGNHFFKRINLSSTNKKTINNSIPKNVNIASNKGIVDKLTGNKNLLMLIGIAGKLLMKGLIPTIKSGGVFITTLLLKK